nr:hypothetical protein [Rappaport israeli]
MIKGKGFDLEDFREQLNQMRNIDLNKMLEKFPGMSAIPQNIKDEHLNPKKSRAKKP